MVIFKGYKFSGFHGDIFIHREDTSEPCKQITKSWISIHKIKDPRKLPSAKYKTLKITYHIYIINFIVLSCLPTFIYIFKTKILNLKRSRD